MRAITLPARNLAPIFFPRLRVLAGLLLKNLYSFRISGKPDILYDQWDFSLDGSIA
jgi:hypothetical protein